MTGEEKKDVEIQDSINILKYTDLDVNTIDSIDLISYNLAVKNVLNLIEKLKKENEELKVCYHQSKVEIENLREKRDKYYLLISKIREKLSHYEGLKKSEFQKHFEETGLPGNDFVDAVLAISRINLLKELLKEE